MKVLQKQYKELFLEIVGLVVVTTFIFFVAVSLTGKRITNQFFDGIRVTDSRNEVVVIGVDDKSLQALGAWPWDRTVFADLTKMLDEYGVKVIVYDVLFLEKRKGDEKFSQELQSMHTKVLLGSKIEREKYYESFFVNASSSNVFASLANVLPDIDGKVRKYPSPYTDKNGCVYGLGEQAFRVVTFKKTDDCVKKSDVFFRYPEHITTYSLVDVLDGKINPDFLKNKVVFIGSTALDLEDHFVGMNGEKIGGVFVHASIFTSLLNNEGDIELPYGTTFALFLSIAFLVIILLRYAHHLIKVIFVCLLLVIVIFIATYFSFNFHTILPLPWMVLTLLVSLGYSVLVRFLQERKRSERVQTLFSKYVHKDVLKELMKQGDKITLTGERKYITVLFSDLRGFTTLSERVSPEDLTSVLNGYFSEMTPIILDEHGTVDKFIGDAVMAFWNAPLHVDRHEERAVSSALQMQDALTKFNKNNGYNLSTGIGIHAGNAVVGNVGSSERVNYTILGDTVNLASRVEGLTKKYGVKILVTEEVMNKVKDSKVLFRKLDRITVKGKVEPTVLYEAMKRSEEKEDLVEDYAIAFNLYQKGDFEEALVLFRELAKKGDIPSQVMYERIAGLEKPDDWDGVWHFKEK